MCLYYIEVYEKIQYLNHLSHSVKKDNKYYVGFSADGIRKLFEITETSKEEELFELFKKRLNRRKTMIYQSEFKVDGNIKQTSS